jgi:DNA-binding NtrC family response regulator
MRGTHECSRRQIRLTGGFAAKRLARARVYGISSCLQRDVIDSDVDGRSIPMATTTILLLVSDDLVRSILQEALESAGFLVIPTADLGDAVDWLKDCTPALLITRGYLSTMSGHDAAKHLRKGCPHLRVLIVGGLPEDDRLKSREENEGFEVFPKPYPLAELVEKVKVVLKTSR